MNWKPVLISGITSIVVIIVASLIVYYYKRDREKEERSMADLAHQKILDSEKL